MVFMPAWDVWRADNPGLAAVDDERVVGGLTGGINPYFGGAGGQPPFVLCTYFENRKKGKKKSISAAIFSQNR